LTEEADISIEVITSNKQKVNQLSFENQGIGNQQILLQRNELPAGKLLVCLKKGRERFYTSIEN